MKDKIIAISASVLAPGGVETHVKNLCLSLRKEGYGVIIYGSSCHWNPKTITEIRDVGVKIIIPPSFTHRFPLVAKLWAFLLWALNRPNSAITLYCIGAGKAHGLLRLLAGKCIFMINHEIVIPPSINSPAAECIKTSDVSIANSKAVLASMEAMYPEKTIKVIPFITAITSVPPPKPRPEIGNRTIHIGYMGRLEARKRPDKLVKEWEQIIKAEDFGEAILHIYGDDAGIGMLADLRHFVEEEHLSEKVIIHGRYQLSDIPRILSSLDLIVLPSEWEGLPLVLVEAMQHGVPFVATCAGGTSEFQENNPHVFVTGLEWESFVDGLVTFVRTIRSKAVDNCSLHDWVEQRYGYRAVWPSWESALTDESRDFWK